jgi:Ca-activated chloride channel family protein
MMRHTNGTSSIFFSLIIAACAFVLMTSVALSGTAFTLNQINIEHFPEIRIYLTIADERGNPLKGLGVRHLRAQEDGDVARITSVVPLAKGDEPLSIVLAIDRSGSMRGQAISDAKQAAIDFLKEMRRIDRVGVVSFDDTVTVIARPSTDKESLSKDIQKISVGKDTALNDAVKRSLQLLAPFTGRRAVVVLTDGKENRSTSTREEVIQEAVRSGVPIVAVGLGKETDAAALKMMAEKSGGRAVFARTSGELSRLYQAIARQLINQYRVTLQSRASLDNGWHRLRVAVKTTKGTAEVERLYLAALRPPTPTGALEEYHQGMNWLYLLAAILCALVVVITAAIIIISIKRIKKGHNG